MPNEVIDVLRRHDGGKVFHTLLHYDPSLEQAPAHSGDIVEFAPESRAASIYELLLDEVEELIERYGNIYAR
jgi:cellulose biosynthesis protein BcsQ